MIKFSKQAKTILALYLDFKVDGQCDTECIAEVKEDLTLHINQKLEGKALSVVTEYEVKQLLAEMGELEALELIKHQLNSDENKGFIRESDFSVRHRKLILSTGLVLLCFFFFKFLVFDGLQTGSKTESFQNGTYTEVVQAPQITLEDFPKLEEFINKSQPLKLVIMITLAASVSFWFWVVVECLLGEKYPKKGIFFSRPQFDRFIWLIVFIFLNVIGAIIYKVVINRKLRLEGQNEKNR